jgi:hypothetical protein
MPRGQPVGCFAKGAARHSLGPALARVGLRGERASGSERAWERRGEKVLDFHAGSWYI